MRSLWIGSIALVGLLGAGCAFPLHSATSTTSRHAATSTTLSKGPITPTATDTKACASFHTLKTAGSKATSAELKAALKEVRGAENPQLRAEGRAWSGAVVNSRKSAAKRARIQIAAICSRMGLA